MQLGLGGADLGLAGHSALLGHAAINFEQGLAFFHRIPRLHLQRHNGPRHLGREQGIAHRLDLGLVAVPARLRGRRHGVVGQSACRWTGLLRPRCAAQAASRSQGDRTQSAQPAPLERSKDGGHSNSFITYLSNQLNKQQCIMLYWLCPPWARGNPCRPVCF